MDMILKESFRDIYQSIIKNSIDAVVVFSVDGKIVEINSVVTKILGYAQEEIQGLHYHDLIVSEHAEKANHHFTQVLKGDTSEVDIDIFRKNRNIIHSNLKSIPLMVKSEIVGIFTVVTDMTEFIQMKSSLKESKERYRKVVEYSPKGIMVHLNSTIFYANPAALAILKETSLVGHSIFSFIHPDDHAIYQCRASEAEIGKELPIIEMKMVRRDGEVIFVEIGGVLVKFDGCPYHLTLFSDITERKKNEHELQESEKRYRLLADNSLDLIQLVNLEGIVTYASPSHKTVLGYEPEEYVDKWVFHQHGGDLDENFLASFLTMVTSQQSFTCEIIRRHKQGYDVWVELKGTLMFDEKCDFQQIMLVGREITERKEYQKKLEYLSYNDPLTGIVNRRSFQEKLDQTIKEAKRYHRHFAVMFIDIDNFKRINDTFGHDAGDQLLKEFSNRVKGYLRESDTFARLGGDEFTILFPEVQEEQDLFKVANRILNAFEEPWQFERNIIHLTLSIGIAIYPKDGTTSRDLLKHADSALYVVKKNGKNNWGIVPS